MDAAGAFLVWLGRGGALPPLLGLGESPSQPDSQQLQIVWTRLDQIFYRTQMTHPKQITI